MESAQPNPVKKPPHRMLAEIPGHNNEPLEIWYSETIGGSPAMSLFLKTYAELIDQGWATPHIWNNPNNFHVIYCKNKNNEVLAGITFEYRAGLKQGWIILTFTQPNLRGQHINQHVQREFETMIKARGGTSVSSHIHIDNKSAIKSAERVGRHPEYYKTYKSLI